MDKKLFFISSLSAPLALGLIMIITVLIMTKDNTSNTSSREQTTEESLEREVELSPFATYSKAYSDLVSAYQTAQENKRDSEAASEEQDVEGCIAMIKQAFETEDYSARTSKCNKACKSDINFDGNSFYGGEVTKEMLIKTEVELLNKSDNSYKVHLVFEDKDMDFGLFSRDFICYLEKDGSTWKIARQAFQTDAIAESAAQSSYSSDPFASPVELRGTINGKYAFVMSLYKYDNAGRMFGDYYYASSGSDNTIALEGTYDNNRLYLESEYESFEFTFDNDRGFDGKYTKSNGTTMPVSMRIEKNIEN